MVGDIRGMPFRDPYCRRKQVPFGLCACVRVEADVLPWRGSWGKAVPFGQFGDATSSLASFVMHWCRNRLAHPRVRNAS